MPQTKRGMRYFKPCIDRHIWRNKDVLEPGLYVHKCARCDKEKTVDIRSKENVK